MRKRPDEIFDNMDRESIIKNLQKLDEVQSSGLNLETNDLRNKLKSSEWTKYLMCWHDGSTIGGHNYTVITISVMFSFYSSIFFYSLFPQEIQFLYYLLSSVAPCGGPMIETEGNIFKI